MSKLFIENSTLTAIGDAIREKTGKTALIAPGSMPAEIKAIVSGGGGGEGDCNGLHVPEEALVLTGEMQYRFAYNGWNWFIEECADKITSDRIMASYNMFFNSKNLVNIPLELNFYASSSSNNKMDVMFSGCNKLVTLPTINNAKPSTLKQIFYQCFALKSIPDDWTDTWDWSYIDGQTSQYNGDMSAMFQQCVNLRNIPAWTFLHQNPYVGYSYATIYNGFDTCLVLERVEGIRLPRNVGWTSNAFNNTFKDCARLKSVTFALQEDGSPYVHNIKNQTIDLSTAGFVPASGTGASYWKTFVDKNDFPEEAVIDSYDKWATYCGEDSLDKGSGNGYANNVKWSTFSRKAAKRLFATLPDVTGGSGNTIKLEYDAASELKSQEAMKLLTEEEIAVAAARGWTVSLV